MQHLRMPQEVGGVANTSFVNDWHEILEVRIESVHAVSDLLLKE